MNDEDLTMHTLIGLALAVATVVIAVIVTIGLGGAFSAKQETQADLCRQKGGVYVQQKYGPDRCFNKDAFIQ